MLLGMSRDEITAAIVEARLTKGLTWQQLADAIDKPVVWTVSALLGQHPVPVESGKIIADLLGLDESAIPVLAAVPMRGGLPTAVATGPTASTRRPSSMAVRSRNSSTNSSVTAS